MIIGVTPARGGSKGIPRKNLQLVNGRPLISYAIQIGLEVPELDHYIVSTDDKEIAEVSRSLGANVPFLRPFELATDIAPMMPVLEHSLLECESFFSTEVSAVVLLDPTAPLRTIEDVSNCIEIFDKHDCNAVISVNESSKNPYFNMISLDNGYCQLVMHPNTEVNRRQDAPEVWDMNTVVSIYSREAIVREKNRIPTKTIPFIVPRSRSLDIDTLDDLRFLEHAVQTNSF